LQGNALDGINIWELIASGEPLPESQAPSRAPSHASIHTVPERDEPMRIPAGRSTKTEWQPLCRPRGTGDDPFGIDDLDSESSYDKDTNIHLEGIPSNKFEGDRVKTLPFLTQFKQFMLMNHWATNAQDPYMKAAFFLSLMDGPKVEGWTQHTYDWLDQVEADPSLLPFRMNAWQALETDFKKSFVNYAEHKHTQDELRKLKMKDSNVDEYVAAFQLLGHRAGMNLDDPSALWLFARGLPKSLADSCIDIDSPENFEQWANAVQCHHQNYLKKLAVHQDYTLPHPQNSSNRGGFFWHRNQVGNAQPARPCLPPRDPNAMDTSAVACKAVTEAEKEKHQKKGCCFECSKQGHLARDCPDWPRQLAWAHAMETTDTDEIGSQDENTSYGPKELAALLRKLSEDDKDSFIRAMQEEGKDMGFQNAWMIWLSFGCASQTVYMYLEENQ
jgi:hypothetical protein